VEAAGIEETQTGCAKLFARRDGACASRAVGKMDLRLIEGGLQDVARRWRKLGALPLPSPQISVHHLATRGGQDQVGDFPRMRQ